MERLGQLRQWAAAQISARDFTIEPASEDASFRRYFRIESDGRSFIVMDAPPSHENCRPFIQIAQLFGSAGVNLPKVLAQNLDDGFLLLSDLGNTTYLDVLNEESASPLYLDAVDSLIKIQLISRAGVLPDYDETLLNREMDLFNDWYVQKNLNTNLELEQEKTLSSVRSRLLQNILSQPKVFVHRDYHCRNLMFTDPNPGILDFQDAVYGPITYDLASLFKDAYISWDEERVLDWVIRYWERAKKSQLPVSSDFYEFYRDFEWIGVQRHLKVVGIFSRLAFRDGKTRYLDDIPQVLDYLKKTCARYSELSPLFKLINELEGKDEIKAGYTF